MNRRGTAQYRFRAGFVGIPEFAALEIQGGGEEHEVEKFRPANSAYAEQVSGQINVSEVSIKLVIGRDQVAIEAMNRWFDDFFGDVDKTRRTGFADDLDEAGLTPIMTRELVECVPLKREHDQRSTEGKGVATITFTVSPERVFYYSN